MIPSLVTNILATARRSGALLISFNPTFVDEVIILFTPQHSGKGLTLNIPHIIREGEIGKSPIERIDLRFPLGNHIIKFCFIEIAVVANFVCQFESNDNALSGRNVSELIPCSAFGAEPFGVDGVESRLNDDVERSRFRTMIERNESFVFIFFVFGVFDDDVPVTIFVKDIRVEEFEFADFAIAVETLLDETFVGIFRLRVFVEVFDVRVRGGIILEVSGGRER